jgi:hypothetical protein
MSDPPSSNELKKLLEYNQETGIFTWKQGRYAGKKAGFTRSDGYVQIKIKNTPHLAHRLAWLYVTGQLPLLFIDHIDHDRANNVFTNLREVTKSENSQNVKRKGFNKRKERYDARIMVKGVSKFLGYFDTQEEAKQAYLTAKKTLHPVASQNCFEG